MQILISIFFKNVLQQNSTRTPKTAFSWKWVLKQEVVMMMKAGMNWKQNFKETREADKHAQKL